VTFQRNHLTLYFVMGSANCKEDPRSVLHQAIAGGITMFQFREKGIGALTGEAKYKLAKDLHAICREHGIPFIVNDDVQLALELDADGVHIGQEDGDVEAVRKMIGDKLLGVSTHTVEEAKRAFVEGADYIGVGPMYPTKTKEDIQVVRGPIVIEEIRNACVTGPLVAIGGIQQGNIAPIAQAGADGIAVISAITHAVNNQHQAAVLKEEFLTNTRHFSNK
jgi:thiamine-phosphate pyrophosphorylase